MSHCFKLSNSSSQKNQNRTLKKKIKSTLTIKHKNDLLQAFCSVMTLCIPLWLESEHMFIIAIYTSFSELLNILTHSYHSWVVISNILFCLPNKVYVFYFVLQCFKIATSEILGFVFVWVLYFVPNSLKIRFF